MCSTSIVIASSEKNDIQAITDGCQIHFRLRVLPRPLWAQLTRLPKAKAAFHSARSTPR